MKKIFLLIVAVSLLSCQKEKTTDVNKEEIVDVNPSSKSGKLHFNMDKTELKWTAYKTPDKIGVDGSFNDIELINTKESNNVEDVLSGSEFKIDVSKVNTNNEDRDAKIAGLFFGKLEGGFITGTFGEFKEDKVTIEITMNGTTAKKDFTYSITDNKITIKGDIDIIQDFKAIKGFDALHKACQALHLNKTWTDVSIEIVSELEN